MKSNRKNLEAFSAVAALVLATAALGVSVRSCTVSQQALELSQEDFVAARTLVLTADYDGKGDSIRWKPLGTEATLQAMRIVFPPSLGLEPWPVLAPEWELPTPVLTQAIREAVLDSVARPPKDKSLVGLNRMLPVIVEAVYVSRGELRETRSIYDITFDLSISDRETTPPQVDYKSAVLVAHVSKLPASYLDKMWRDQLATMQGPADSQ